MQGVTIMNKNIKQKNYFVLYGIFLYSFILIPVLIYQFKYFFYFSGLFLYLFSSLMELSFVFCLFYILFHLMKKIKLLKYLYCLSILVLFFSYFIQGITFYISGDLLPTLAIENMHEYKYHFNNWTYFIIVLFLILSVVNIYLLSFVRNIETQEKTSIKTFIIILLSFCFLCIPTIKQHSPAISLITNGLEVFCSKIILQNKNLPLENFLYDKKNKEYPFLKDTVYNNNKYFKQDIKNPNVIIIFMEGISAKFVGCYEDNFDNITPNIDKFANNDNVCKFDNYYNHTAATFRGIIGTLSSGYPYHGGFEGGVGWEDSDNSETYKQINYSSLPKLVNKIGYTSIMFSPHVEKSAFSNMVKMLGFDELFFAQKSCKELLGSDEYTEGQLLSDKGIFLSLKQYLKKHENEETPKFICLYNRGSHALSDVGKTSKMYGDGKNQILNRIHNLDYELGQFLDYFYTSPYTKNTYLIITTDHCTYYEPAYKALFSNEKIYCFTDKIPLLIYSPFKNLPKNIDTNFRTSLDFAPTLLNLLNIKDLQNSFLGYSLFDLYPYNISIGTFNALSSGILVQIKGNRYFLTDSPKEYFDEIDSYLKLIDIYQYYEQNNKLFPE